jgi:hypothetical protein
MGSGQEVNNDWEIIPAKDEWEIIPPPDYRGQFGLGTATSIGPQKPPKLFSVEGARQYGGAVVKGLGKLATGITQLGPSLAQVGLDVEQNLQNRGVNPLTMGGFDVVRATSEEAVEPLVRGYAESWKQMVKNPGKFILEQPDAFVGNVLDVLTVGAAGATKLARLSNIRKMMAGKEITGATVKAVLKPLAVEAKNAEVESLLGKIPDDVRIKFPQQEAGAVYGEGGSIIGQEALTITKPTVAPPEAMMGRVSPMPPGAELERPSAFDYFLPEKKVAPPVGSKIRMATPKPPVVKPDITAPVKAQHIRAIAKDQLAEGGITKAQHDSLMEEAAGMDYDYSRIGRGETVRPLSITSSQMKMGLKEAEVELFDNPVSVATATPRKSRVLKVPDEIPAEAIINESRSEALRKATPEQPLKMVYTAGGDLRQVLGDLSAPAMRAFEGAKLAFHSPDVIFYRHPAGRAIYDYLSISDLAKDRFLVREGKKLSEAMGGVVHKESLLSSGTFKAADTGLTIPQVIKMGDEALKHGFTKDELIELARYPDNAEKFRGFVADNLERLLRQYGLSKVSKETESKLFNLAAANKKNPIDAKLIEGLTETEREVFDLYGRKIKDYIPHIFDKQEMVEFIGGKLSRAQGRLAKLKDTRMVGIYKKQVEELTIALEKAQRGSGNILYDDFPSSIKFKFFEPRTGAKGYQVDAVKAYRTYLTGIAKKIFDEPAVRLAVEKYTELPTEMQAYTKWYLRDYLGYNRGPFDDLANGIKSVMWMKALGFNPRSAVVNWTQKINTVIDSNPMDSAKGYAMGFTKEGRDIFDRSGLVSEVPQQLWEGTALAHRQGMDDVRRVAGFMFGAVEKGNKKHALLTGYYESLRKGMDEATAMARGIAKADKTQFRYGRVNMPRALRGPVGVAFQFWSYPIKQLEFLGKLWKENPAKFFAWVAVSEGANKSTQDFLGTDLSSALGLGVNWGQLFTLVDNIAHGADAKQILYQLKKVPSGGGIFPYGLGPGISAGSGAVKLVTDLLNGADIDVADAAQLVGPTTIFRAAQNYDAIKHGKDASGLYTVKSTRTGQPVYKETGADLAKRMLLGRPMTETKTILEGKLKQFKQKSYNDLVSEISDLYADGKIKEAFELMAQYKIRPTKQSIKAAFERKALTRAEREGKKKPSKARLLYEKHLEEGIK